MDIELKIDNSYDNPKIVIYANKVDDSVSNILNILSNYENKKINAFKNETLYIFDQSDIETIYSENNKTIARVNNEYYTLKNRLYELEQFLDKTMFLRISNSEIVNFNQVKNIDFKIIGTIILNFKSGNKAYSSRRYIPKIKEFLNL